ncbi:transcription initiation factor IIB [Cardiosporidium cionae]|uniref:General transcription factor TFIIB n=1 Tax=Cardiosporidium cionae TaxID=476202 RepID=A0ABQ7J9M6_9APIC|nr:transcription initiation factor IIB [Cardiosporidium cionae]|eukprot:KAF8820700.1 transcription initiation factor IIB [Cardiosporidium cionae]
MASKSNGEALSFLQERMRKYSSRVNGSSSAVGSQRSQATFRTPAPTNPKNVSPPRSTTADKIQRKTGYNLYGTTRHSKFCPNCEEMGRIVYDQSSGDELCCQCGLILESKVMSEEQEWRNFCHDSSSGSRGADRNRVGEAIDHWLDDGVAGTTMLGGSRRFQQLNEASTSLSSNDKLLRSAFQHLRLIAEAFSLRENIVEIAKEIAKELQEMNQLKNRGNMLSMLAVIYLACREANLTRTIKELIIYDRSLTEKELGKAINRVKKLLPQRGPAFSESATQLLPRLCSRLNLSINITDIAEHVTKRSQHYITTSHRPNTLAAGAIFFVVQLCSVRESEFPKASKIAEVTGAGEHTMKNVCKELLDYAEVLLPSDFRPMNEGGLEVLRMKMGHKGVKRKFSTLEG